MRSEEIKTILESIGRRPSKRLGQHFLIDDSIIKRQVERAELHEGDVVLEIGPGLGNLTEEILSTGADLVAVEQDPDFCRFLTRRFGDRIRLIQADAVKAFLPEFDKVVSNLPYQISSPITFKLLEEGFDTAILMVQREFADRMVARAGTKDYGRLSVGVNLKAECEIVLKVPRCAFWPQPKVDSCVVKLTPRPPPFEVMDERLFLRVTKAVFTHRRKKISNSLVADGVIRGMIGDDPASKASLPYLSRRPEELTPEMLAELANAVFELTRDRGRTS
ncbi:MAG TPA: 16S rRNA (adenine(1518)-N(6)/adenine(1519)-N(6))-dimethyltransferase RsmA [Thermoplasmata archaeon]|jgi:16S rRNA (adenine1518-N6/adenine1519-N6)-dimethyltransferase|nr:16S rRNA (adenine(1518)-N(6)/adenine(1519)-N(6))-dimethyltransferase RsmA [Thermoplasmata archaeon]